jgi:hypothetical protein
LLESGGIGETRAMIPPPPTNEQAFFEVAATLIPVLLLGGALLDRLRPTGWLRGPALSVPIALMVGAAVVIWAETIAIAALIRGESSTFDNVFVALVLVFAMVLIVGAVLLPWLRQIEKQARVAGALTARERKRGWVMLILLGLIVIGSMTYVLTQTLESAEESRRVAAAEQRLDGIRDEQDALWREIFSRQSQSGSFTQDLLRISKHPEEIQVAEIKALIAEDKTDTRLNKIAIEEINDLELEAANIVRELVGEPPLEELQFKDR